MRYCICGQAIPRRKEKGHREREYCSDRCRKRARNKGKHDIARIIHEAHERMWTAVHQDVHRESWQDDLERQDHIIHSDAKIIQFLTEQNDILKEEVHILEDQLAEKEAEITRLNTLPEHQAKRRPRQP